MSQPELDGAGSGVTPVAGEAVPGARRIGVYVCHCGGNISDYVDVAKVVESVQGDGDVAVARTAMFACSDASQQDMIEDIQKNNLDGLVVASCSPKLHTFTFRARRDAGRAQPVRVLAGQHPRAVLLDPQRRSEGRDRRRPSASSRPGSPERA